MRLLLFFATNVAVLIVLWLVTSLLGVDRYLTEQGMNYPALLAFCAVFGFGGSFISLLISKWVAVRSTGAVVVAQPSNDVESWLVQTVAHQAQAAGIGMPDVAIFPSESPNAFATAPIERAPRAACATCRGARKQRRSFSRTSALLATAAWD